MYGSWRIQQFEVHVLGIVGWSSFYALNDTPKASSSKTTVLLQSWPNLWKSIFSGFKASVWMYHKIETTVMCMCAFLRMWPFLFCIRLGNLGKTYTGKLFRNFKWLKNREVGSDFDDFWTKRIAALSAKIWKKFGPMKKFPWGRKCRKTFAKSSKKLSCFPFRAKIKIEIAIYGHSNFVDVQTFLLGFIIIHAGRWRLFFVS